MMFGNKLRPAVLILTATFLFAGIAAAQEIQNSIGKKGIAAQYPGDEGIEKHQSVVFTENFEGGTINKILENWTWNQGADDHRISLDAVDGPNGSSGSKSLKMTILRTKGESGSDLRKIFEEGYEELFFRFYVKFADDYGFNHHFTSMSGDLNPTPWSKGRAGLKPEEHFSSTIDQLTHNTNKPGEEQTPPGYWAFYSYWPEMKSWQSPEGIPDGRSNPYYGNVFMPNAPVAAKRGEWQCVEIMIRLNSAADKKDGAHAFWIDGKLAGSWDPEEKNPVKGYWMREVFRHDPDHKDAIAFPGIDWRSNPDHVDKLKINIIRLQNYVSDTSWKKAEKYVAEHPDFKINLEEATVWKDHIVVATEYIGPIEPVK